MIRFFYHTHTYRFRTLHTQLEDILLKVKITKEIN